MTADHRTALLCDDDAQVRGVEARLAADAGYEVIGEADNALDAIQLARILRPDVIVLDLSMAGMNGVEALPELRQILPACRIVVCTAFDVFREQVEQAGAAAMIDKSCLGDLSGVLAAL